MKTFLLIVALIIAHIIDEKINTIIYNRQNIYYNSFWQRTLFRPCAIIVIIIAMSIFF